MRFTYRWGQRPLDGFTIKRGLGQGGFGEVYFAVSDGGKEVAPKLLVRGRTDTERRGSSNRLNFKHPTLVHPDDLRTDERGEHGPGMEDAHGAPGSDSPPAAPVPAVPSPAPTARPPGPARAGSLRVANAVSLLHARALVQRDTKPGPVFVEHGALKLGGYGLSKSVTATALTQS